MSSTVENKNILETSSNRYKGILQFNEETKSCYILTEDGGKITTTPMFDFFNCFISLQELLDRSEGIYDEDEMKWFLDRWDAMTNGEITPQVLYTNCQEKFKF